MERKFVIKDDAGYDLAVHATLKIKPSRAARANDIPPEPAEVRLLAWWPDEESSLADSLLALLAIRQESDKSSSVWKIANDALIGVEEAIETHAFEHADEWAEEDIDWRECARKDI